MEAVFERRRRLLPRPGDLSYYNWVTHVASSEPSANFQVGRALNQGARGGGCQSSNKRACLRDQSRRRPRSPARAPRRRQVIADDVSGLQFKNKRDRKVLSVDPCGAPGDSSCRTELVTHEYGQVVLFDHVTRRRG